MSASPSTTDSAGPVELLLAHSEKILSLESELRLARIFRALLVATVVGIPSSILGLYIATALTWQKYNMKTIWWPAVIVDIILIVIVLVYAESTSDRTALKFPELWVLVSGSEG